MLQQDGSSADLHFREGSMFLPHSCLKQHYLGPHLGLHPVLHLVRRHVRRLGHPLAPLVVSDLWKFQCHS